MPSALRFTAPHCAHIPARLSTIAKSSADWHAKAKGQAPLRELAPSSDLSKIWLGIQITTHCHFSMVRSASFRLRFLYPPSSHPLHELSRFPSACIQFPECLRDTVAGSQDGSSSTLLLEDLSSVVLNVIPIAQKARGTRTFCRWKWRHLLWEKLVLLYLLCRYARANLTPRYSLPTCASCCSCSCFRCRSRPKTFHQSPATPIAPPWITI